MFCNKRSSDIGVKTSLSKRLLRWGAIVGLLVVVVGLSITVIQQVQFQLRRKAYFASEEGKKALHRKQEILDHVEKVKQINQRLTAAVESENSESTGSLEKELENEKEKFKAWFRATLAEDLRQDAIRHFQENSPGAAFIEYDEEKGVPVSLAHDAEGVVKPEFMGPGGAVEHVGRVYPLPNNLMVFLPIELSGEGIDIEGYLEDILDDGKLDKGYCLGSRGSAKSVFIPAQTQETEPTTSPTVPAESHVQDTVAESPVEETPPIAIEEFLSEFIPTPEEQAPDQNADARYPDLRIERNPQASNHVPSENDAYMEILTLFESLLNNEISDWEFESLLNQLVEESIYKEHPMGQRTTKSPSPQPDSQMPHSLPSQAPQNRFNSLVKEPKPVIPPDYPSKDSPEQRQ